MKGRDGKGKAIRVVIYVVGEEEEHLMREGWGKKLFLDGEEKEEDELAGENEKEGQEEDIYGAKKSTLKKRKGRGVRTRTRTVNCG